MKIKKIPLIENMDLLINQIPPLQEAIQFRMDKGHHLSIDFIQQGRFATEVQINRYKAFMWGEYLENLIENLRENENNKG
jgi:hypothetical protein